MSQAAQSSEPVHAMTVTGPVGGDMLGATLVHEHVIANIESLFIDPATDRRHMADSPVSELDAALLRRDPLCCRDNCRLNDVPLAAQEVEIWRAAGGGTIVECTSVGLGRDIRALQRVAALTEVNIIAPTGFYLWHSCRDLIGDWTTDQLYDFMAEELTSGIDGTEVLAGVIGEIGTSAALHEQEVRVLTAAGALQRDLGTPVSIHVDQDSDEAHRILDILIENGADPARVVLGHLDQHHHATLDDMMRLADRGAYLGFDTFGTTFAYDSVNVVDPTDDARIVVLAALVKAGYGHSCVLSHDVGMKNMLRENGGGGYAHLSLDLAPALRHHGISAEDLTTMWVDNPRRWLTGRSV